MKKFLAILLSALLVAAVFAIPASAATWKDGQVEGEDGNYTFDNAYGFVFEIDAINTAVVAEGTIIVTTTEKYNAASLGWCNSVVLDKVEDNVYSVNRIIYVPQATANETEDPNDTWQDVANVNLTDGQIVLAPHSAYSNPKGDNWEAKLAANALKVGDKITLADIDVAAGTLGENPTATVQDDVPEVEIIDLWLTHYNDSSAEGAGVIFTEAYSGCAWWNHIAFAPVEDAEGDVYEIIKVLPGDGNATPIEIPEGGFVYATNVGNNWPGLFEENGATGDGSSGLWFDDAEHAKYPNYVSVGSQSAWDLTGAMTVGQKYAFSGLDLENLAVPTTTPDAKWYEEGYVCTAKIALYEGYNPFVGEGDEEEVPAGPIYVEKVVSSYKDYTHSTLYRQLTVDPWGWDENSPIAYPDDELKEKLTNGAVAKFDGNWDNFWGDNSAVLGFHGSTKALDGQPSYEELGYNWIQVDLGAAANLNKFTLTAHNFGEADCVNNVKVFVSTDKETWTEVGSADLEVTGDQKAVIELDEAVSAQYVEYRFTGGAHWQFVSEVEAIEVVERVVVDNVKVPVTGTDTPCQYLNGEVIIWNAGEEDTVITSDDANLRYSWFIVTDAEGKVVKIGNNLVKASEGKVGFINEVTVPANGQLIAFFYNADNNTNEALMGVYNDVLLVANNGAAIYNTYIDVESDYILTVADGEVAIDCTAQGAVSGGDDEEKVPGDMSNMIVFALLAVVAIAGSAVVIKTRR